MTSLRSLLVFVCFALLGSPAARACMVPKSFSYMTYARADIVLSVKVLAYKKVTVHHWLENQPRELGQFTLEPVRTGHGMIAEEAYLGARGIKGSLTAYWRYETFQLPDRWQGPTHVIAGLKLSVLPDGKVDIFVAEETCSDPALMEDTKETWSRILAARRTLESITYYCHRVDREGVFSDPEKCP